MRNRWNQSFVAVLVSFTVGFTGCASMQTTMTNMGNSLAFWKKSAPKDQFASNLTSPSATGTPTGAYGPNSMANNQPSSYPFANAGNRQNGSGQNAATQTGFGQGTNVASNTAAGTRSPYSTTYPSTSAPSASGPSQFGASQPSMGQPAARTASSTSSSFPGSTGSYSPSPNTGFNSSYGNPSRMNTTTPSSQFQSSNGYQPNSSSFTPSTPNSGGAGFSPGGNSSPAARTANQPADYPSTPYGKFGSTQAPTSPTTTTPPSSSSFKSTTPYPSTNPNMPNPTASTSGFNPGAATASTTAPAPTSTITRPPSLPSSVFSKSGGYSPGSTGVSGTATQAGFESQDSSQLYKPNTASKIPTQKSDLYTPGQ